MTIEQKNKQGFQKEGVKNSYSCLEEALKKHKKLLLDIKKKAVGKA